MRCKNNIIFNYRARQNNTSFSKPNIFSDFDFICYILITIKLPIIIYMSRIPNWDIFTTKNILLAAYLIGVVRFALMAYVPELLILILAQVMHAATFGAHHSASIKLLQTWFKGPLQARGQALYTTVSYGIGGTVGGLFAGWVWEYLAPHHVFGLAALSSLLGYLCMSRVKPQNDAEVIKNWRNN